MVPLPAVPTLVPGEGAVPGPFRKPLLNAARGAVEFVAPEIVVPGTAVPGTVVPGTVFAPATAPAGAVLFMPGIGLGVVPTVPVEFTPGAPTPARFASASMPAAVPVDADEPAGGSVLGRLSGSVTLDPLAFVGSNFGAGAGGTKA